MTVKYSPHQYSLTISSIIKRSHRRYLSRLRHSNSKGLALNFHQFEQFNRRLYLYLFAKTCEYNDCYI